MFALLVACALGQASSDPVAAERTWLAKMLEADLQAQGQADAARLQQTREQIGRLSPAELQSLVDLYQRLKQGASPTQVYTEVVAERDQSMALRDELQQELDLRTHVPNQALTVGAGYAGAGFYTYTGAMGLGPAIYGGLPTASMYPGSYGGAPLPYAGPMGFGTFTATGPVVGYSAPFLPSGPSWPMGFGP